MNEKEKPSDTPPSEPQAENVETRPAGAKPAIETYSGYQLTSNLIASLVSLLVGIAWPATVVLLLYMLLSFSVQHGAGILSSMNAFLANKESLEVSAGKAGLLFKVVQRVQNGLVQQVASQSGASTKLDLTTELQQAAASAVSQLAPRGLLHPETTAKVLWVDDHPENNIGLQYAFQSLGMVVICIDSNSYIKEAFDTAREFDVVITDMFRNGIVGGRSEESEAGLQTVSFIRDQHPEVPVIIYSGSWASSHATDVVKSPAIAITNDPQRVFSLVANIASKKLR